MLTYRDIFIPEIPRLILIITTSTKREKGGKKERMGIGMRGK